MLILVFGFNLISYYISIERMMFFDSNSHNSNKYSKIKFFYEYRDKIFRIAYKYIKILVI